MTYIEHISEINDILSYTAFSEQGISTKELLSLCGTSNATINKRLSVVEDNQLLITNKQQNKKYYAVNLQTLDESDDELINE